MDFAFDQTTDARTLELSNVIDEYTTECLAIDVARSIDTEGVFTCLERLSAARPPMSDSTMAPSSSLTPL